LALYLPEQQGGLGQPFSLLATLYTELGSALSPAPLLGSMLAVNALADVGEDGADNACAALTSGAMIVGIAADRSAKPLLGRRVGDAIAIDGRNSAVLDAADATHVLLRGTLDDEPAWFLIAVSEDGIVISPRQTWDFTRRIAEVAIAAEGIEPASLLCSGPPAIALDTRLAAHFDLAIACDSLGGAAMILEETLAYLAIRHQFGRPIGSFQAIKHRCADLKVSLEGARALVDDAALSFSSREEGWSCDAASAKVYACEAYRKIAVEAIQLHGGIGFTWEQDCHLFLKRALLNEQLGGSPEAYQDWIAAQIFPGL
jgi:alkylation response protein AidB-like acyl-CoA dehydrogenase